MSQKNRKWPTDVPQAVNRLLKSILNASDREALRNTPEDDLARWNHGLGTTIRNSFGLWAGNDELLKDCGTSHPDDASHLILHAAWARLRKSGPPATRPEGSRSFLTLTESTNLLQKALDELQGEK
jgi:hypothetical protein